MRDVYVEWLVKRKQTLTDKLIRIAMMALSVISILLVVFTGQLVMMIIAVAICVLTYMVYGRTDLEYEYTYVTGELMIDRIMARSRRKRVETIDTGRIEVVAPLNSPHLDGHKHKKYKECDYSSGVQTQNSHIFVMYHADGKKIILEPNRDLMQALRDNLPHKVHIDF